MGLRTAVVAMIVSTLLGGALANAQPLRHPSPQRPVPSVRAYFPSDEVFANPERGWIWTNEVFCNPVPISVVDFDALRAQRITVIDPIYVLDEFRDAPLSTELLAAIDADFALARAEGFKLLPRFTYNWNAVCTGTEDATLARIEQHVMQLTPVLAANQDVTLALQVSFIGRYGEMHTSSNGLVLPNSVQLSAQGVAAFHAILDAVPIDRAWCIRYPKQKRQLFAGGLTAAEAFGTTDRARVGLTNHGFGADETDFGTWDGDATGRAEEKAWAELETRFVPQFGEPAASGPQALGLDSAYVLNEVERFHYSGLVINQNDAAAAGMYDAWRASGAFDEMARRFGYRYTLVSGSVATAKGVRSYEVTLRVRNEGYAVPVNPRAAEIVLRSASGDTVAVVASTVGDLRTGFPAAGETRVVTLGFEAPPGLPAGAYDLLLSLPDPAGTLHHRPEYAIRLANEGVWEPGTGWNRLGLRVTLD